MIINVIDLIKNIIIYQLFLNEPLTRLLTAMLIFSLYMVLNYFYKKNKRNVRISDYEIHSWWLTIFIFATFISLYVLGFFVLRLYNISKSTNIYKLKDNLIFIIETNTYFSIVTTLCLLFSVIILVIFLIKRYRETVFKYCLQIHFFIINKYPLDLIPPYDSWSWDKEQPYESFRWRISEIINGIRPIPYYILDKIYLTPKNPERKKKLRQWLWKHYKYHGLFLLLLIFVYDLILNKGIITKIYYILPLIFIYFLLCKLYTLFSTYERTYEIWICTFLYSDMISTDLDLVYFSNKKTIPLEDLNELLEKDIPSKHKP